jgi:glycosyltransferase involved in cell wall biosynthesis
MGVRLATMRQKEFARPVRIGIDGRRLGPNRKGIGRYVWELCKELDKILPAAQFFLYSPISPELPPISHRWSIRIDNSALGQRIPNNLWLATRAGLMTRRDNLDVFWAGTGLLPLIGLKARGVLTVHDLVQKVAPETMDFRAWLAARMFFSRSLAKADAIVSVSSGTADRLGTTFGYRVAAVVRPGLSQVFQPRPESDTREILARYGGSRPYLLSVSTLEPRKGLEQLIRSFLRMKANGMIANHKLLLVGDRGWKDSSIVELVRNSESVIRLGFVDDTSLAALYSGADALIFPSTYEGFGMPVLEARACGARVVTSDLPELREAGGDDAIYVTPTEQGICSGISLAVAMPKAKPIRWQDWNWTLSADALAEVLLDCAHTESAPARAVVQDACGSNRIG